MGTEGALVSVVRVLYHVMRSGSLHSSVGLCYSISCGGSEEGGYAIHHVRLPLLWFLMLFWGVGGGAQRRKYQEVCPLYRMKNRITLPPYTKPSMNQTASALHDSNCFPRNIDCRNIEELPPYFLWFWFSDEMEHIYLSDKLSYILSEINVINIIMWHGDKSVYRTAGGVCSILFF